MDSYFTRRHSTSDRLKKWLPRSEKALDVFGGCGAIALFCALMSSDIYPVAPIRLASEGISLGCFTLAAASKGFSVYGRRVLERADKELDMAYREITDNEGLRDLADRWPIEESTTEDWE